MIKSLQKKFISVSIIAIAIVVSLVFVIINYLNYFNINERNNEILKKLQNNHTILSNILENNNSGVVSSDKYFYNGFIIGLVDENNEIKSKHNVNTAVNKEETQKLLNQAIHTGKKSGYVGYYKYGYLENTNYKYIVLIDCEKELRIYYQFLKNSILIGAGIIFISSVLLILLARKLITPIKENYEKQKRFITDASHELKTPLTIISSNADVLEMEIGKSKWLLNIHNQIERLTNLINSLVAFSRVEEDDNIDRIRFSLTKLVNARLEDFNELAIFKNKIFISSIQKEIFYFGEKQTITQVIDILLDNAVKYADLNSQIYVELYTVKRDIFFIVKNKAKEIKKGDLNKVFDRFYRLDESRNSKIKGYGIGLSLAKLIIDKHKSTIKAYSQKDGEFIIEIKLS